MKVKNSLRLLSGIAVTALSLFSVTSFPVHAANLSSQISASRTVTTSTPQADPAGNIAMNADAVAKSRFADIYGGMALTNNGSHVNIYLTKLDSQAEKDIVGFNSTSDFSFLLTPHNSKQMDDFHQKVIDAASKIRSQGINLVAWGPDVKTGKEEMQVVNLTPDTAAYLNAQFGSDNIELQNVASAPVATTNRSSDSAPWNGGDFITNGSEDCTSGFPAHNGVSNFFITAGHCFTLNTGVDNGSSALHLGTDPLMGTVTSRDTSTNGLDVELVNTSSYGGTSNIVWAGSSSSPTRDAVSGATTSPVGYQVCQSGSYDGEICGLTIQNNNLCITEDGTRTVCHIVEATNTSGGVANGAGDSGGPVFRFNGSYLEATGITAAGANPVPCVNYPSGRSCYSTLYYTDINTILSNFGLALNT